MIEGSQIPIEQRVSQLSARVDDLMGQEAPVSQSNNSPQDFRAMAMMMQAQMLGDAMNVNNDDNHNSNSFGDLLPQMMMMQGASNPMLASMMMGGGMTGSMNPMMAMMMSNPMMGSMNNSYSNPLASMPQMQSEIATDGSMVFPLQGTITSSYGHRHDPLDHHHAFHSGVDIAAPLGSPIRMPWEGRVVYVGQADGFGQKTVIVAHENNKQADGRIVYSVFGHNQDVFVRPGDLISQGEVFATVGNDGHSTGPHLHWETRIAEPNLQAKEVFQRHLSMTVDPMSFTAA